MARGTVNEPQETKELVWEYLFIKKEPLYTLSAKLSRTENLETTEYQLRKLKKHFIELEFSEWAILPEPLKRVHRKYAEYKAEAEKCLPRTPLQQEAYEMCSNGDHSWFNDSRFDGHAYKFEVVSEAGDNRIQVLMKRTCHFCGHVDVSGP